MLPEPLLWYTVGRILAGVVAIGAVITFAITYVRRETRHTGRLRGVSISVLACTLIVLLFVNSPLDYHAPTPAPAGTQVYALSQSNDLIGLHATDGSWAFIRHLPDPKLQDIVYDVDGLLIATGVSGGAFHITLGNMTVVSDGALNVTHGYERWYLDTAYAIRAFHRDDGSDALPKLGALKEISATTVDHGVLYVVATDDSHPNADVLYAFLLRTGEELWHRALSTIGQSQIFGIDHGILYIWLDTTVAAVRVTDGALIWQRALTTTPLTPHSDASATYYEGMFYAGMLYIWLDTTVAAVRVTDGALIWQSSPLVKAFGKIAPFAPPQGDGVYVRAGDTPSDMSGMSLIKLDVRDGSKKWTLPGVSSGAISGNRLYGIQHSQLTVFDTSTGAPVWQQQGVASYSSFAVAGVLYVVDQDVSEVGSRKIDPCEMFAIRMSDNAELWRRPSSRCLPTDSLLAADGMLYFMSIGGYLTVMRTADGSVPWTHRSYRTGGMYGHWADNFYVLAASPGVIFIDSDHAATCSLFGGCDHDFARSCQFLILDCSSDVGHYIEAVDPATGRFYWRYRLDGIFSYLIDDGAA